MTNEEKTENIISKYKTKYNDTCDLLWTDIKDVAMEMAKWKDEQYVKVFAKLIVELDELKHQVKSLLP